MGHKCGRKNELKISYDCNTHPRAHEFSSTWSEISLPLRSGDAKCWAELQREGRCEESWHGWAENVRQERTSVPRRRHTALPLHQNVMCVTSYKRVLSLLPSLFSPSEKSSNEKINGMRSLDKDVLTLSFSPSLHPTPLCQTVAGFLFSCPQSPGMKTRSLWFLG